MNLKAIANAAIAEAKKSETFNKYAADAKTMASAAGKGIAEAKTQRVEAKASKAEVKKAEAAKAPPGRTPAPAVSSCAT